MPTENELSQPLLVQDGQNKGIDNDADLNGTTHEELVALNERSSDPEHGSSIAGAIFNFTNSIVGAGAIGLGGAIAQSGGLVSVLSILFIAILTKISLDLLIQLSIEQAEKERRQQRDIDTNDYEATNNNESATGTNASIHSYHSYETLGQVAFGNVGRMAILISKFLYSFGCLVAYIIVVKDNFGSAVKSLFFGSNSNTTYHGSSWLYHLLSDDTWTTWAVSALVIFPLCLLRDMTPLANLSMMSIMAMICIVFIIVYQYVSGAGEQYHHEQYHHDSIYSLRQTSLDNDFLDNKKFAKLESKQSFQSQWVDVHWGGVLSCLGTFVFTFVSQHTVHLAFESLKPNLRTLSAWRIVSAVSLAIACTISLTVGVVVYLTFGKDTQSDIFRLYRPSPLMSSAKLLLCLTMLLTFPLPFFACRELLIVLCFHSRTNDGNGEQTSAGPTDQPQEVARQLENTKCKNWQVKVEEGTADSSFLTTQTIESFTSEFLTLEANEVMLVGVPPTPVEHIAPLLTYTPVQQNLTLSIKSSWISYVHGCAATAVLMPGQDRQLKLPYHLLVTGKLWAVVTGLAIAAPSLGDVLDLVGCATGTLIAFVFPALLCYKLTGKWTMTAAGLLAVGGILGLVGTYFSVKKLIGDIIVTNN